MVLSNGWLVRSQVSECGKGWKILWDVNRLEGFHFWVNYDQPKLFPRSGNTAAFFRRSNGSNRSETNQTPTNILTGIRKGSQLMFFALSHTQTMVYYTDCMQHQVHCMWDLIIHMCNRGDVISVRQMDPCIVQSGFGGSNAPIPSVVWSQVQGSNVCKPKQCVSRAMRRVCQKTNVS